MLMVIFLIGEHMLAICKTKQPVGEVIGSSHVAETLGPDIRVLQSSCVEEKCEKSETGID